LRLIKIFDTTMRDGEQSPGASMTVDEKLQVARQLARLGVDIIEAGFAISSPGDFEAIKRIGAEVEGPVICSLARAREEDIKRAWEAIKDAPGDVFIPSILHPTYISNTSSGLAVRRHSRGLLRW